MDWLWICVGLVALIAGGEGVVRAAVQIAQRFNISPMVIGLTLVGFGTSLPELLTSVQAALIGAPGIAVGNVVGSNIANILLILGVAVVLTPMAVAKQGFMRDGAVLVGASTLCLLVILHGQIGRVIGAGFVGLLLVYLLYALRSGQTAADDDLPTVIGGLGKASVVLALGLAATLLGAKALVLGAVGIAQTLGVSEAVIGLTVVAIGTSMPELVTSVMAARKGQVDVALGNIIGSNIFNILGILGVTALVHPLQVPAQIVDFDIWVMMGATLALCLFAVTAWTVSRREGGVLLAGYAAYLGYLVAQVV